MDAENRKYYEAYDERYITAHSGGVTWESMNATPIVMDTVRSYGIRPEQRLLEIGCGEGRDAKAVLENGYDLVAVDISTEAIAYCKKAMPAYADRFKVLNCLDSDMGDRFDFIYAVAVIHMLVPDEDRNGLYAFIHDRLNTGGKAIICSMGDGETEARSDISKAFEIQERDHFSGRMNVACTSCRTVSFATFESELKRSRLKIIEQGITGSLPNFNSLMYAVVERDE